MKIAILAGGLGSCFMKKLLITGTNGFIGNTLCAEAVARGFAVRDTTRTVCDLPMGVESIAVGNIDASISTMKIGALGAIQTPGPLSKRFRYCP
jgi:hypothetical protein